MTRFHVPFLVALVAVGMTLPVRRPASTLPRPVSSVTRAPTTPIRVPAPLTKRPAVGIAGRSTGGPNSPFPGAGRLPIDPTREEVSLPQPGNPSRRPISVERPDLDVSYRPGPEIRNPNGNNGGGGGNNGGGRHPHPGRRPCHGPTGWDLVAIGLATAALVDGGVGQGVCYANDSVTVGQPTCCVGTAVVESQAVIEENATTGARENYPNRLRLGDERDEPNSRRLTSWTGLAWDVQKTRGHRHGNVPITDLHCPWVTWVFPGKNARVIRTRCTGFSSVPSSGSGGFRGCGYLSPVAR